MPYRPYFSKTIKQKRFNRLFIHVSSKIIIFANKMIINTKKNNETNNS